MAASDSRNPNTVTTPSRIAKDFSGPDNPIPLSPQWLLPKPAENKTGVSIGENRSSPLIGHGDRPDFIKSPRNGEEMHEGHKKKDIFRPESGRRDRWRDEERETNPSARRDRWREGEKEIGDSRKIDRWVDTSSTRHYGEARRAPSEKWADPSKENSYDQRRESKWNSRWGPDDKEMDKWMDVGKHGDTPQDKGPSHLLSHGKDEKEGDHYRPWRPSSLQNRAKAEPPHHLNQTTMKEGSTFGQGRGRGDSALTFSVGRGRVNYSSGNINNNYSAHSHSSGSYSDRGDNILGEPSPFRYNRTKLLDVYRLTDLRSSNKFLDGLTQVSHLTQEEPLEPLALSRPTLEESAILKGIDKGEIVSSGSPQISKDGSSGRSSNDFAQSRRIKHGSRDDVSIPPDEANDKADHAKVVSSKNSEYLPHEKQYTGSSNFMIDGNENHQMSAESKYRIPAARDDDASLRKVDEGSDGRDSGSNKGHVYPQSGAPWRSPSVEEHAKPHARDWYDTQGDIRSRSDISWSQAPKDHSDDWNIGEDSGVRKHPTVVADWEQDSRKLLHPSPEDLLLYYKDPQGQIQGPFSGGDIIGWFEAGYFGIDLLVRLVNAPNDSAFSMLGDVMPHLRAKARPPPGFNAAKQNEVTDIPSKSSLSGFGKVFPGPSGIDLLMNEHRRTHGSSTEAENRFLESLMSGDVGSSTLERFASSEGLQGFLGQTSSSVPSLGAENGDALSLLAQRMNLERQNSLTHPYQCWPTRDVAPLVPNPDIIRNSTMPQANLLSTVGDIPQQSLPQNADMMSILQGMSDRSSGGMNTGLGSWPNFGVQGGNDQFKEKLDLHHGQNFPQVAYGMQQHNLQQQNHPSINNLLAQTLENPNILSDKRLQSGLPQDPQALNLLQQQYLLQLQSQQSVPSPQMSMLDKIRLLKQKEQQQLLLQQQQLLSQVMSEQQLAQFQAFGQFQASASAVGNAPVDNSVPQLSPSLFQVNSQISVSGVPDDRNVNVTNMPPKVPQDLGQTMVPAGGSALHLPHQMVGIPQQSWHPMSTHVDNIQSNLSSKSEMMENFGASEARLTSHNTAVEHSVSEFVAQSSMGQVLESVSNVVPPPTSVMDSGMSVASADSVPVELPKSSAESLNPWDNDREPLPSGAMEEMSVKEHQEEVQSSKETKNAEAHEVKKASDKKSKKTKSSKAQPSSDQVKGSSKASSALKSKRSEAQGAFVADKSELSVDAGGTLDGRSVEIAQEMSYSPEIDVSDLPNSSNDAFGSMEGKSEQKQSDSSAQNSVQVNSAHRAWKPAVCVKPKSLLEIQQEEQKRAQMEIAVSSVSPKSLTPWAGLVTHPELKVSSEVHQNSNISETNLGKTDSTKSKKSGLHDLLAAEVLAKSSDKVIEVSDNSFSLPPFPTLSNQLDMVDDENFIEAKDTKMSRRKAAKAKRAGAKVSAAVSSADLAVASSPPFPTLSNQLDMVDDENFIEAKDTKMSRRKAAKAKRAGAKVSAAVSSADLAVASSPIEKGKSSKVLRAEKEVLPTPPVGPSLGDFVPWKGESTSPSASPAWLTDSGKLSKPTSLRDILKEQQKKFTPGQQNPVSTPQKSQPAQIRSVQQTPTSTQKSQPVQTRPGSWSVSALSPSKAASPVQIHPHVSSQSKNKGEDDLFWGPPDQSKQETKQAGFPQLGNQGNWTTKSTAVKGSPGASISRQRSSGARAMEQLSSSPTSSQVSAKGKRDGNTKHMEAMDFRDWCESESVRLTGSKDTSFLEFCLKQSRSEAETLLTENLGSFDPNHEFIEKFLNYKELLQADVIELAFQSRYDLKAYNNGSRDMNSDNPRNGGFEREGLPGADESGKGGKKKGKKGKKVSAAVLGFNVVSNRIMMGEIQNVED